MKGATAKDCGMRWCYLRSRLCPGNRKYRVGFVLGWGWGGMANRNTQKSRLRLWGGCNADEPFDQKLCSKYFGSDNTQSPLTSSAALYLIRLPLISLICPHILKPICRGSPSCSLKFFSFFPPSSHANRILFYFLFFWFLPILERG